MHLLRQMVVLAGIGFSFLGYAERPLKVLVYDSPVDTTHEYLEPFFDEATAQTLKVRLSSGKEISLQEYNQWQMAELGQQLHEAKISGRLAEQYEYLERIGNSAVEPERVKGSLRFQALQAKAATSPWKQELEILQRYYLHGTHVAALAMRGLDPSRAKFVPFAALGAKTRSSMVAAHFDSLSGIIRQGNFDVVNLSIGSSSFSEDSYRAALKDSSWMVWAFQRKKLWESRRLQALFFREGLARVIHENPRTIFVLAAGNENRRLESEGESLQQLSTLRADNLVVVQASTRGRRADFSNFGEFVTVAAPGNHILSARVGGGGIKFSGTSMAAPQVTEKIIEAKQKDPEAMPATIIARMLEESTHYAENEPRILNSSNYQAPTVPFHRDPEGKIVINFHEGDLGLFTAWDNWEGKMQKLLWEGSEPASLSEKFRLRLKEVVDQSIQRDPVLRFAVDRLGNAAEIDWNLLDLAPKSQNRVLVSLIPRTAKQKCENAYSGMASEKNLRPFLLIP